MIYSQGTEKGLSFNFWVLDYEFLISTRPEAPLAWHPGLQPRMPSCVSLCSAAFQVSHWTKSGCHSHETLKGFCCPLQSCTPRNLAPCTGIRSQNRKAVIFPSPKCQGRVGQAWNWPPSPMRREWGTCLLTHNPGQGARRKGDSLEQWGSWAQHRKSFKPKTDVFCPGSWTVRKGRQTWLCGHLALKALFSSLPYLFYFP